MSFKMTIPFVAYIRTNKKWYYWVYKNGIKDSPSFKSEAFNNKEEASLSFHQNFGKDKQ